MKVGDIVYCNDSMYGKEISSWLEDRERCFNKFIIMEIQPSGTIDILPLDGRCNSIHGTWRGYKDKFTCVSSFREDLFEI